MTFPERLQLLRKEHNVSQTAIAKAFGLTRQAYNNYERGIREPNQTVVKELAHYFGVTTDYILGVSDEPYTPHSSKEIDEDLINRLKIICFCLSETGKKSLLTYAEMLFAYEYAKFDYEKIFDEFESGKISKHEMDDTIHKNKEK